METFIPPVPPDLGANDDRRFRTQEVSFGDGYSQRARDGINNRDSTVTLNWSLIEPEEADAICVFLDRHGGTDAFLYQRVDEPGPRKWICKQYSRRTVRKVLRAVSATLTEVFDPE